MKENIRMMKSQTVDAKKDELDEGEKNETNKIMKENNGNALVFFLAHIKMININAKTYAENCFHTINVIKKDNKSIIWIKIHDKQDKLGVKNMSDLTIKAIKGIYDTEIPTKE